LFECPLAATMLAMKENAILMIASLLTMLFATLHLADDIVLGFSPGGLTNLTVIFVLVIWLYATLILSTRASGYGITLLLSLLSSGVPVLHFIGRGVGAGSRVGKYGGAFFFIWTLFALGASAMLSFILAARGLWSLRRERAK
jgi:hypothetical protein